MCDKISIIIPVYNSYEYLDRCYNSISSQTYSNIEIIFVDDDSKDNSLRKCQEYAKKDNRVKVIHKENSGPANTRNVGLENATGKYIMFCDSDDWYEANICEELYNLLLETDSDVACCDYVINDERDITHNSEKILFTNKEKILESYFNEFLIKTCLWNKIYKREIVGRFDDSYVLGEDALFICETLLKCDKVVHISKALYHYFINENSITHTSLNERKVSSTIKAHIDQINLFKESGYVIIAKYATRSLFNAVIELYNQAKNAEDAYRKKQIKQELLNLYKVYNGEMIGKTKVKVFLLLYFEWLYRVLI